MKKRILTVLKVIVSVSLLGYLFNKVDLEGVQDSLAKVSYWSLVAAATVLLLQAVAGAVRLSMVIKTISSRINLRAALHIMFIGLFFNQTLPSSIGGDAMRIWRIRHHGFPLRTAINSVLLDRLIALVALGLFMLMSYPVLYRLVDNSLLRVMVAMAGLALIAGFAVLYYLRKIPRRYYGLRITEEIRHMSSEAHRIVRHPRRAGEIVVLSVVMHAMTGMAIYEVAHGLGLSIGLLECVVLTPPISLITVLPISMAGWGVREAGMVTALAFAGITAHDALVVSILFGLLLMLISIPGGVFWLYTHRHTQPDHN
ncbi:MAG: lysylphosphatidylglycerol synthase transmembrane domain-containing protein [Sulfuricaulis sp.]